MSDPTVTPAKILETGFAFWPSRVLLTAVELGVFTRLGARSMTAEELGTALDLHPRGIYDFFDTLVALGFLKRDGDGPGGRYRNTDETATFLDREKPAYVGGILEMFGARLYGDAFDFTGADFGGWCREAGFSRCEVLHLNGPCSAAIAYK